MLESEPHAFFQDKRAVLAVEQLARKGMMTSCPQEWLMHYRVSITCRRIR